MANGTGGELIAFYGSLMRGFDAVREIGVASGLRFVGPCRIAGELVDLGNYPGLLEGPGLVVGEIHALIDPDALIELDRFEGYDPAHPDTSFYVRRRVRLVEPADTDAWVYVLAERPDPLLRIESGDWKQHLARRGEAG